MNMIYKVIRNSAADTWVAASELSMSGGRKRTLHKSTLAAVLVLSAPFGTAWASETCELANGQKGILDGKGLCVVAAPIFGPKFEDGGGDDSGEASNVAIGSGAQAVAQRAVAIGVNAYANSQVAGGGYTPGSTAIGAGARAEEWNSTALGSDTVASGPRSVALGRLASSTANGASAIGSGASATHVNSVALGYGSTTNADNTVSVGSDTNKRKVVNLAAGTADNDATNFAQLKSTAGSIATAIGGGSVVNPDGTLSVPSYSVDGTTVNSVGDAITNIDGRVINIEGDLNNGTIGLVRQDAATGDISVAAASGGTSVNFTGTDGARVLSGVANGIDDSDAATIAQLKASGLVDPNDGRALGALVYDDLSLDRATLGGTNGTVIANMGNGLIAVGSREGVNGGQLATIRDDLQSQIGGVRDRVDIIEDGIADGSIGGGGGPIDDNEGRPISNVGDGVADTDAANMGQVNQKYEQAVSEANVYTDTRFDTMQDDFNQRFEAMDGRIDRMAALSGAYAGMAMNTAGLAGKNRVGAGVGVQGGKAALAVGYQRIVGRRNNASVSIGGAFSGSEKSVSAGAGFSW